MIDFELRPACSSIILAAAFWGVQPVAAQQPDAPMVSIPLRDAGGTVVAQMNYRRDRGGSTAIYFVDTETRSSINTLSAEPVRGGRAQYVPISRLATIPLHDAEGNLRAFMGITRVSGGLFRISFMDDLRGEPRNVIEPGGGGGRAPTPTAGSNPLEGYPRFPQVANPSPPGGFAARARQGAADCPHCDNVSNDEWLLGQVRALSRRIAQLEERLNAASRPR